MVKQVLKVEGITFHDLYESYPDFDIDLDREQELLLQHDVIVFQHPFYWYSCPAILKQWEDLVLEHGWAYGRGGTKLSGKILFNAITAGGREEIYQESGYNRFTIKQLLVPFEQTAQLCKMIYLPPFVIHDTHRMNPSSIELGALRYKQVIEDFKNDKIIQKDLQNLKYLNEIIPAPSELKN